MVVITRY